MKRKIWIFPWKYPEGFLIGIAILICGLILDYFFLPAALLIPSFPGNLILLSIIVLIASLLFTSKGINSFLSSGYAAVPSIVLFTLLVLIIGIIPQNYDPDNNFNLLRNMTSSWTFYLSGLFMFFVVFTSSLNKFKNLNIRNLSFILTHIGISIVLLAGGLGQSEYKDLQMNLFMNKPVWYAAENSQNTEELDFALELNEFILEYHNPVLKVSYPGKDISRMYELDKAKKNIHFRNFEIVLDQLIPEAIRSEKNYREYKHPGYVTAAALNVKDNSSGKDTNIWITSGSRMQQPEIYVSDKIRIKLLPRSPKHFITKARLYTKSGVNKEVQIQVNKPLSVQGWKLYQQSYNQKMGKYSNTSVLRLVKNPWLPVMYVGFFMILSGVAVLFFIGKPY